jgi:hypothetical protein
VDNVTPELEERVLQALDIRVRQAVVMPTSCEKCGEPLAFDSRAGELWHMDRAANLDHRPVYAGHKGSLI